MSHPRTRYAQERVEKLSHASPLVGVLGQRQVGKSTLLNCLVREYITFDRESVLRQAVADPELFLKGRKLPCGIDEAQLCPELFPALKEHVRMQRKMGQFILSGSVRFTGRKAIRESLTGRILNIELLPFSIAEAHSRSNTNTLRTLCTLKAKKIHDALIESPHARYSEFTEHLQKGGLPGICLSRDPSIRDDRWQTHIDTLLNRDYRLIHPTSLPYDAILDALLFIAQHQGRPFELKSLSAASRISFVTIKKVLNALESLFLIRSLPLYGDRKGVTYYLEDQGMATWLMTSSGKTSDESREWDIVRGLYSNLRHEIVYRPELRGAVGSYLTRHGVLVHLVFDTLYGKLGIIATPDEVPRPKTLAAAQAFLKKYPNAKVVIAYTGKEIVTKSESHFWVPFWMLI